MSGSSACDPRAIGRGSWRIRSTTASTRALRRILRRRTTIGRTRGGIRRRWTADRWSSDHGQVDATPRCVQRVHGEQSAFADGHDVTGRPRSRVTHELEGHVAASSTGQDVGAVRREVVDLTLERAAHRVRSDELDEGQGVVERFCRLARRSAAAALSGVVGHHGLARGLLPSASASASAPASAVGALVLGGLGAVRGGLARATRTRPTAVAAPVAALVLCVASGPPTDRSPHGSAQEEDPTHTRDRLPADEATLLEHPGMGGMELLERVVRQDRGADLAGDLQDEGVAAADGPRRRRDQLAGEDGFFVLGPLGRVDAVREGGIDHDGEGLDGMLVEEGLHRIVELAEAGRGAPFGRDVGAIDDDV